MPSHELSESELVGDFYEELAAVGGGEVASPEDIHVGIDGESGIEILLIGVVANIDFGAGMRKVREEEIEVKSFRCLQRCELRICQGARVLGDETECKVAIDLVIPFRAHDVVVKNACGRVAGA